MKYRLKYLQFIVICFVFIILLQGCKKAQNKNTYNVAIITDTEYLSSDYKSLNIEKGVKSLGNKVSVEIDGTSDKSKYLNYIDSYVNDEYNLIITAGFLQNSAIENLASKNPKTSFLAIDSIIDSDLKNLTSINFKTNESSFLAGYISGLVTKTNKIGYIGLKSGLITDLNEYGFKAGLLTSAKELKKEIAIKVEYIEDLSDYNKGKEVAKNLYNSGIDIIYQTTGYSGVGSIEAAKELNKLIIGYDVDQSYLAPKNVLTSTIKNYDIISENIVLKYLSKDKIDGQQLNLGIDSEAVGITKFNENSIYGNEIYTKAMLIKEKIKNKEISVPYDKESFEKFK